MHWHRGILPAAGLVLPLRPTAARPTAAWPCPCYLPARAADTAFSGTVFAPNDTAFEALLEELNKTATELLADRPVRRAGRAGRWARAGSWVAARA